MCLRVLLILHTPSNIIHIIYMHIYIYDDSKIHVLEELVRMDSSTHVIGCRNYVL